MAADTGKNVSIRMTNEEIIDRLKRSDLSNIRNVQALFDMARNTDDLELCKYARDRADELARKGSLDAYELVRETYLWAAPRDFDSYLIYLEWNRRAEERFYLPRRKQLRGNVEALQDLADDKLDELFLSMPPRVGKLLADSTPVLTVDGWKNHGDLKVGDYVFSPDGVPVRVIAVHPKHHTTHTVTMTDGSSFKCHFRHEWKVWDCHNRSTHILETQEIQKDIDNGKGKESGHRYKYHLVDVNPIKGVNVELPVKPYTLGAWIGDGANRQPAITIMDEDWPIVDSIIKDGYEMSSCYKRECEEAEKPVSHPYFESLRKDLQKIGLCKCDSRVEKFIPDVYLVAPIEYRLELLAGLLDTDGYLMKTQNRYEFSTSYEEVRDGFISLVATFGWRVSVDKRVPRTKKGKIQSKLVNWRISFNPDMYIPCRIERKQLKSFDKHNRISIKSIVESEPEPGNCITVEGGMYLVGQHLIPTHNTSLLMFYMTWQMGRDSEQSNLYCAYSDTITNAFYNGVLEILNDPKTYLWRDVFPEHKIAATNSKNETINIDRNKRYASLTCRSLYGTLNGSVDADGTLVSDDLLSGIEEALNKDRLVSVWSKVDNNMLTRAKGKAKILWCGTRWSMIDPIGLRIDTVSNNEKFKGRRVRIINTPALNEKDESNFEYLYGVGFSSGMYQQRRASFERNNDMASWLAQYMGEPIERDGAVFSPQDFRYYNGVLPDIEPDRIFAACDPSWGGGDYTAMPVCYKYGNDIYVADVVYDNGDKRITQRLVADKVVEHNVAALQIEATKTTEEYAEGVDRLLRDSGRKINLTTKTAARTVGGKQQRIFDKAPDIRERMIFLENGKRSKPYQLFMQNVFSFKVIGKNKNDDAPDSLCMAIEMDASTGARAVIIDRLW